MKKINDIYLRITVALFLTFYGLFVFFNNYHNNTLLTIHVSMILVILLFFYPSKLKFWIVPYGVFSGIAGDVVAYHLNLWTYANPTFAIGTPLWLPISFAYILILFYDLALAIYDWMLETFSVKSRQWIINILRVIIVIYALIALTSIARLYAFVLLLYVIPLFIFARSPFNVIFFVVAGLHGTAFEYVCMQKGIWAYNHPIFPTSGVPLSLPLAWACGGTAVWFLAKWSVELQEKVFPKKNI